MLVSYEIWSNKGSRKNGRQILRCKGRLRKSIGRCRAYMMGLVEVRRWGGVLDLDQRQAVRPSYSSYISNMAPGGGDYWSQKQPCFGRRARHKEFRTKMYSHPQDIPRRSIRQNLPNSYSFCEMMRWSFAVMA